MSHLICTFNANNLFVRYQFGQTFPGDRSAKSLVEDERFGYLPVYNPSLFELFNDTQRELSARALTNDRQTYPDVICLQEVESLIALRKFNEAYLEGRYRYALLVDSRDFRQIDVGILSQLEILNVRSHIDDLDPTPDSLERPWLFSRDCLEVEIALGGGNPRRLSLFINHLKSKFADTAEERTRGDALRQRQAEAVMDIVRARFHGAKFSQELFAVVGDMNDEPLSPPVRPLTGSPSGLEDAIARIPTPEDRWTHWYRSENTVSQLDHLLLSPALAAATAGQRPRIGRKGISFSRILADGKPGPRKSHFHRLDNDPNPIEVDFRFQRFPEVTTEDYASDHCPVFFEIP